MVQLVRYDSNEHLRCTVLTVKAKVKLKFESTCSNIEVTAYIKTFRWNRLFACLSLYAAAGLLNQSLPLLCFLFF